MSESTSMIDSMVPTSVKNMYCCKICGLVKNFGQFQNYGCENCSQYGVEITEGFLTRNFEGVVALMNPSISWVGKYKIYDNYVPGLYALEINEDLSQKELNEVRDLGIPFIKRVVTN
eukprot:TRINITY_DN11994_c0_g1_i1.p1 TRINITY_DN11994_c0_g1~~TRINITY_DN11994_c0_g1_i1.p1  ORF type:complete len:117 (+),score=35.74 TRINITY_DN11994_c0_g1_i1:31-381(+)